MKPNFEIRTQGLVQKIRTQKMRCLSVVTFVISSGFIGDCLATEAHAGDSIDTQIQSYRKILTSCGKNAATPAEDCQQKFATSFKALEQSFKACTPGDGNEDEDEQPLAANSKTGCASLERFISQEFVLNSPSFSQVSKALKFINQRTQMSKSNRQTSL